MTILNTRLWVGLLIPAVITLAAVLGGIEWAFASLGAMVLISMAGISIYMLANMLRRSGALLKGGGSECGTTSAVFFDGDDLKHVTYSKPVKAGSISKEDKRIIMEHVDELFKITQEQSQEKPAKAVPISKEDKRLIMKHIDELFTKDLEQNQERLS